MGGIRPLELLSAGYIDGERAGVASGDGTHVNGLKKCWRRMWRLVCGERHSEGRRKCWRPAVPWHAGLLGVCLRRIIGARYTGEM